MRDDVRANPDDAATTAPARPADDAPSTCPNCRAVVTHPGKHCPHCGARLIPEPLGFIRLIAASIEHLFELELPIARTCVDLCRFPGRVAREYIAGRRKVYTNPLKYNLITAVVLVFIVQIVVSRVANETPGAAVPPPAGGSAITAEGRDAGTNDAPTNDAPANTPAIDDNRANEPAANAKQARDLVAEGLLLSQDWHNHYLQIIYVLTVPILAWMLKVSLGRRAQRATIEYYVMGLYAFGQIYLFQSACLALALLIPWMIPALIMGIISSLSPFVYLPWMTIGFVRPEVGAWRAGIVGSLAFLLFTILIGIILGALGVAYVFTFGPPT